MRLLVVSLSIEESMNSNALVVVGILGVLAGCDGGGDSLSDTQGSAQKDGHLNDSIGDDPCDNLVIDNVGIPEGYPFGLVADPAREELAQQRLSEMLQAYGVDPETFKGWLDPITYTLTWRSDVDLIQVPGKVGTQALTATLDEFLTQWSDLLLSSNLFPAPESPRPIDEGEWIYTYSMDYCGYTLANTLMADMGESLVKGKALGFRGLIHARLRENGVLSQLDDQLVPVGVPIPMNPILTTEEAREALVGLEFTYECWGDVTMEVRYGDTGEPGEPEVLLLEDDERIYFHLAYPVPVTDGDQVGEFVFWVDALTGQLLARYEPFIC